MPAEPRPSFPFAPPATAGPSPTRTLHLGAAIDCGGPYAVATYLELARLAERGALDFVTLGGDGPSRSGPRAAPVAAAGSRPVAGAAGADPAAGDTASGPPDAVVVLARIAPGADRIGLLAAAPAARGPGTAAEVAALDRASRGRAGWLVTEVTEVMAATASAAAGARRGAGAGGAAGAGRRVDAGVSRAGRPAGTGSADATRRGGDAGSARRTGAGRAVDGGGAGAGRAADGGGAGAGSAAAAAVRTWQAMRASGACPPDCRPVVALDATEPAAREAAARVADLALVRAVSPERAGHVRDELRALAARAGRDPDRLLVLADLAVDLGGGELGAEPGAEPAPVADAAGGPLFRGGPVDLADLVARWQRAGAVDGFHVRPVEPARDLERFVNGTVALLQHRGLFRTFHPGATLREHLGLHRRPRKAPSTHMEGWDDEHTSS